MNILIIKVKLSFCNFFHQFSSHFLGFKSNSLQNLQTKITTQTSKIDEQMDCLIVLFNNAVRSPRLLLF